ncbi:DNA-protecting protein DprA [Actinomyces sp. 2119]|uniref:DNA-processing protein DprA n=2 Tax=Actinomyces TaxID=1654 RepID=UPI000E6BA9A0|nr:DNA-processing protein DprA [Actinomyces sp. 2119]RJF43093.1 DNA-protecting protein DprA [Actinomyces sp. 2119]
MTSRTSRPPRLLPYDVSDTRLARATWSRLAEPADPAAARLVGALGPSRALGWLLEEALTRDGQVRTAAPPPLPAPGDPGEAGVRWAQAATRWAPRLQGLDIRRELDVLERLGGHLVLPGQRWWPGGLDDLEQPPFCLWVRGDPAVMVGGTPPEADCPEGPGAVAVVGARAATPYGEQVASDLAAGLARRGVVVVSGGAFGIDAASHRGALRCGTTLSVSAGGVDRFYPQGQANLLRAVIDRGALVAEVPPGCAPARHRFLTRNRLIAATSQATVVIEAAWRSGALSTAHRAQELGRPVGAVPGPVTSMTSVGCHRLLRNGAVCVTDTDDVLELVCPLGTVDADGLKEAEHSLGSSRLLDGLDHASAVVLDSLPARSSASTEAVVRACGLSPRETTAALGILELAGRVERVGSRWRRRRSARA